jgi:hypothetical protein
MCGRGNTAVLLAESEGPTCINRGGASTYLVGAQPSPTFLVDPPVPITQARRIAVTSTQIQYSQTVILNFNGLAWPHVSVATLVPSEPVTIPPIVWAALLRETDS